MSIRTVKQYSDRGSLTDLANVARAYEKGVQEVKPLPSELRMKQLYEYANLNNDNDLQSAIGFITTEYISDKNALPLSVYRLRKIVADIKSKSAGNIDRLALEFTECFVDSLGSIAKEYLNKRAMVKTASVRKPPLFWRVNKS